MDSHAENTRRIAKNTLMLYVRMLFGMLVSLYTSRVVLNTLGVEDYGIYNVVGGVVAMFSLISNSLSSSVSRFLTFELGRGDMQRLKDIFSTSILIHLALAMIVLVLAETVGVWFLNTHMTIPTERLHAANWVFQASVVSFMFGLFSVPYNASIVAHEHLSIFAYFSILDITLRLAIVIFIAYASFSADKLIIYSLLLLAASIFSRQIYWFYCRRNFEECRVSRTFNKNYWKQMSSFAGWNFIGCTAGLLKDQGVNIILNIYMGPVINAARGIAMSVNSAVNSFVGNFMTALNPQITKSYASEDRDYMFSLVERGARFSFYILLMLTLPILFETEFILTLWLKQYPEHTVNFVRLVLILSMCDTLSNTLVTLQNATGRIRNYQIAVGGILMLNLPLSCLCLELGYPPEATLLVAIVVSICCMALRLLFLRQMTGMSIAIFIKNVCIRAVMVSLCSVVIPLFLTRTIACNGWEHFAIMTIVCVICSLISICIIGCTKSERRFVLQKIVALRSKTDR